MPIQEKKLGDQVVAFPVPEPDGKDFVEALAKGDLQKAKEVQNQINRGFNRMEEAKQRDVVEALNKEFEIPKEFKAHWDKVKIVDFDPPKQPRGNEKVFVLDEKMIAPHNIPFALQEAERGRMLVGIEEAVVINGHEYEVDAQMNIFIGGINGHRIKLQGNPGEFYKVNLADLNWPVIQGPFKKPKRDVFGNVIEVKAVNAVVEKVDGQERKPEYFVHMDYNRNILSIDSNLDGEMRHHELGMDINVMQQPLEALICMVINAVAGERIAVID